MKKTYLFLLFIIIGLLGCRDELSELPLSPFEDESITLLEILDYNYNPGLGRLEVNYAVNFDITQNKSILGILVIKDDFDHLLITDPTQTNFIERNLPINGTVCYRLAFLSNEVRVRETEDICIDL